MVAFEQITTSKGIREYLLGVLSRSGNKARSEQHLFHYTMIENLKSIVCSGYIWLGSTKNMNDIFEGEVIEKAQGENTQFFTCFSRVEENLAMYKMYAPAPNGAMLKISYADAKRIVDELPKTSTEKMIVRIVRDYKLTNEYLEADVYWAAVAYKDLKTDLIRSGGVQNNKIKRPFLAPELAGFLKLYGWEYEKEVRLCATVAKALEPNERIAIKLPDTIKYQIVTGPGFDKKINRANITSLKMNSVEIHDSEYDSFVNLGYGELEEITEYKDIIKEKEIIIKNREDEIKRLKVELSKRMKNDEEIELLELYDKEINELNNQFNSVARFIHSVSDEVNDLIFKMRCSTLDAKDVKRIVEFLQKSVNSFEIILTNHYKKEIRISIKLFIDDDSVKTYVRGKNNINSRGGVIHIADLNSRTVKIKDNYAYKLIVQYGYPFFAEGDLLDMNNKLNSDDYYFCEYDEYFDLFISSVVMPLKMPLCSRSDGFEENNNTEDEIFGFVCIDCQEKIEEWSAYDFDETFAYHILADYVNNIALLIEVYRNASGE